MKKTDLVKTLGIEQVNKITSLSFDELMEYDDELFEVYWFLRSNKLTTLKLTSEDIELLKYNGFLRNRAMMLSLTHLTESYVSKMLYTGTPFDVILQSIRLLPGCQPSDASNVKQGTDTSWFSIQWGPFSMNLPLYCWHLAADAVQSIVGNSEFYFVVSSAENVPIIKLCFDKYSFAEDKQVLEFELINTDDPAGECALAFENYGFEKLTDVTYLSLVSSVFTILHLYEFDSLWRFALFSPIRDKLAYAYEPGDTFYDAAMKCLKDEVDWMLIPDGHIKKKDVTILGASYDLSKYVENPTDFVRNLTGGQ